MTWSQQRFITLKDLGMAYRKAKADLFYERGHPNAIALCLYEENLEENLNHLHQKLIGDTLEWMNHPEFVGSWSVMPKGITYKGNGTEDIPWRTSDPEKAWIAKIQSMSKKPQAEFRMIGIHSIEFHIVSTLWMLKVGRIYDAVLGKEAYGSRLRRVRNKDEEGEIGNINLLSLGTFKPYIQPYCQWRDNGLKAMRAALNDGKIVVAITADVRQFYYRTSPAFLLHETYLDIVGLQSQFTEDDKYFTQALIDAIRAWASQTPIHSKQPSIGIPVGLPAARLIANVALAELDKVIRQELSPLYYGRYMDDIILVMEDKRGFKDSRSVLEYIVSRLSPVLQIEMKKDKTSLVFQRDYLGDSRIEFIGEKQKVFLLEGDTGISLIDSIDQEIRNRSSEWRALPEMPEDAEKLGNDLIAAFDETGEQVDNLRKTDALSTRRAALSISLREMEAFENDLLPDAWLAHRKVFYKTFLNHFITVPRIFDFPDALGRVFGLAVSCSDYDEAKLVIERLARVITLVKSKCEITLAADDLQRINGSDLLAKWRKQLAKVLGEAAAAAVGAKFLTDGVQLEQLLIKMREFLGIAEFTFYPELAAIGHLLYLHDLGRIPFRFRYLPYGRESNNVQIPTMENATSFCEDTIIKGVNTFLSFIDKNGSQELPLALLFSTRPFSIAEFYLIAPQLLTDEKEKEKIGTLVLAFRGFSPRKNLPGIEKDRQGKSYIDIPWRNESNDNPDDKRDDSASSQRGKIRIAITSWLTNRNSWIASIVHEPDPDRGRYGRLNRLMNDIMDSEILPHYVVMPELSIPSDWFYRMAARLATRGISLIAGVEYQHHGSANVSNQVWASFVSDFLWPHQMIIYRQDKQRPAQDEERELQNRGNVSLMPLRVIAGEANRLPIWHGNFALGILICSELTNVESRGVFRGRIDALFVPEWNQDTESFSALVEASALDLHAYIAQCNDRQYGDSRIRAPMRDFWLRDIVRVKGGIQDYFVIGEIDVAALRRFQSWHRSPENGLFKPVPDGFVIDPRRRMLPE